MSVFPLLLAYIGYVRAYLPACLPAAALNNVSVLRIYEIRPLKCTGTAIRYQWLCYLLHVFLYVYLSELRTVFTVLFYVAVCLPTLLSYFRSILRSCKCISHTPTCVVAYLPYLVS